MKIEINATIARVTAKPGKRDKDGNLVTGPTVVLTAEIPLEHLDQAQLGKLLQWTDTELRLILDDYQRGFVVAEKAGEAFFEPEPVGAR